MNPKLKLFFIIWVSGMLGVLSLLLVDFSALLAPIAERSGITLPPLTPQMRLLSLIQPAVLLSLATLVGVLLAANVKLFAPAAQAFINGDSVANALKPQLLPAIIGGLVGAIAVIVGAQLWLPYLPTEFVAVGKEMSMPTLTRFLYGGITEEILLRWGFMTFLVWIPYRFFTQQTGHVPAKFYIAAIIISALIFGIAHLPIAAALAPSFTPSLITYIITLNALFGLIAGYLFWKIGLEAAIIAHIIAHVVMLIGERFAG